MQLNKFLWDIYKKSENGQQAINLFTESTTEQLLEKYLGSYKLGTQETADFIDDIAQFISSPAIPNQLSIEEAEVFFDLIASKGFILTDEDGETESYEPQTFDFLHLIPIISTWLFRVYPDYFKPYFFLHRFHLLTRIADTFGIELPEVPLKRYKQKRFKYYFELCKVFMKFQVENDLTAEEFCAFIYDFAPNYLVQEDTHEKQELPQPTQVWMIGGNKGGSDFEFLDRPTNETTAFWQGNEDTKRGDILVMYCLAPRSYIHSVWRATEDGVADPFFHYYSSINIGRGQKITTISLNELKADTYYSQNPLVRSNFQGVSGYQLSSEDYKRLQLMILEKDSAVLNLPQLYSHAFDLNKNLANEREVETALIEPLLFKLGYKSEDWVRQLTVRMGRGERNFPDYAFLIDKTKSYEKSLMLIESKYWIKNNRQLEETFKQVWSYGQRLSANTLVIADKDAIWIYQKIKDSFDRTKYIKKYWKELENPDNFTLLSRLIGKK